MVTSQPFKRPPDGLEHCSAPRCPPARKPPENSALGGHRISLAQRALAYFGARPVNPSCIYGSLVRWPRSFEP
jgi:hypothetical protein